MQLFCTKDQGNTKNTEVLWPNDGFSREQWSDLTLPKADFPENVSLSKLGTYSTLKDGDEVL